MFGKLAKGGLGAGLTSLTDTVKKAAEGAAGTLEVKNKLQERYGDKLSSTQLLTALELAGSIPFIGTPFKVVATVLEFAMTLPGQTSRTISAQHLTKDEPLVVIPVEGFAIVLSANQNNKVECNFYKNDAAVTNIDSLKSILGDNVTRKHIQNDSLGIDRDIFINPDAVNIVANNIAAAGADGIQKKGEKFIVKKVFAFAIEQSISQVEGYEYLEYIPGFSFVMDKAIDGIAEELAEAVVENTAFRLAAQKPANDPFF